MSDEHEHCTPTVVLLLKEVRRVSVDEARRAVDAELGPDAAATVSAVGENSEGMAYIDWYLGPTPYHLGTCDQAYISTAGAGKVCEPLRWTMKEEIPPEDERLCEAWMSHVAWLYVDALTVGSLGGGRRHLGNVLRIASHFIDGRCSLVWYCNPTPKRVVLSSPRTIACLRSGEWPPD
ncbi:MAG: hypothetical protein JSR77_07170 [Planctomycetes bacterium]|nr:hypothetical protein [Planctomycetota bacterium]